MDAPKVPEPGSDLEKVLLSLDRIRTVLLDLGLQKTSVVYSRKKLDKAVSLVTTLEYLKKMEKKIDKFINSPVFPGIKNLEDYKLLGMVNTQEHKIRKEREKDVKAFWKCRPNILRKTAKQKSTIKKGN